ncbi:hypothetical protein EDB83DRAFT_2417842, partial [Lactarius deliciosus]
ATILPACADSSAFDALCRLGEDPATFIANPTADELLSAMSMLSPQENDDPLSSGSATTDALQVFNFDEYLQNFGGSALLAPPASGEPAPPGTHSVPVETPSLESLVIPSPMPSFYATTPAIPAAAGSASAVVRDAANTAGRRVGGSWKVPLAVSRLASESPIPSCASSPKRAAV